MFVQSLSAIWSSWPRSTRWLALVAAVAVVIAGIYGIFLRTNDFSVHLRYGESFLWGNPYGFNDGTPFYPLGRLWFNAGLASLNYYASRALCYMAAIAGLALTMVMWQRMAAAAAPLPKEKWVPAIAWTLFVLSALIIRDLDECGLQLFLLFFLTAGGYCLVNRWHALSGFWIATAIVYKATPVLFLPLLIWKREWRAAAWTMVFTVVLSLLPATYLGWQPMLDAHAFWLERASGILDDQGAYPFVPGIEPPKVQNESLKALLARYTASYPEDHPIYVDHPLFFQFSPLSDQQAKPVVMGLILLLGAAIAWRMRGGWPRPKENPQFAADWATACLFAALMSPLCWRQHLVMAIPCAYLVARERLRPGASGGWRKWLPVVAGVILLGTRREIVGDELGIVLLSYKLDTLAVLFYVVLALTLPSRNLAAGAAAEPRILARAA